MAEGVAMFGLIGFGSTTNLARTFSSVAGVSCAKASADKQKQVTRVSAIN
jgi:hypothetical protein